MDEARNELVEYHHPQLRYKIWKTDPYPGEQPIWNKWHYHKEVEIILLLAGTMQVETIDRIYELHADNNVLVIGSSRPHRTKRLQPIERIAFQFDMSAQLDQFAMPFAPTLLEWSEPLDRFNDVMTAHSGVKERITGLLMHIYEEAKREQPGFEVALSGMLKQLLALMIRHTPSVDPMSPADWQRLKPVLDYIEAHYVEPIRIHDVLPLVHLEYHYFIKYFQSCTGMSFVDYLHFRRIKKAEYLLLTEPASIADIGFQSGFPNATQFIRIFKRYNGCTPSEFRRKRRP